MGVYRGWEGAFKQHSDIKKNLLCGDGAGLRKCTLEFRPYKEDELAVVQSQHKCGVAGMRRIWEKREQQRRWDLWASDEAGFFQKSQEAFEVGEESLQNTFTKSLWLLERKHKC